MRAARRHFAPLSAAPPPGQRRRRLGKLVLALTLLLPGIGSLASIDLEEEAVPLEEVVVRAEEALRRAAAIMREEQLPGFRVVTLNVNTVMSSTGQGRVGLYVLRHGSSVPPERVHTIQVELSSPEPSTEPRSSGLGGTIEETLVAMARSAATGSPSARKLTAQIRFVVRKARESGIAPLLQPVSVDLAGTLRPVETHALLVILD